MRFELDAIHAGEIIAPRVAGYPLRCEAGDRIEPYGGTTPATVCESHFDAVRELCERNLKAGTMVSQMLQRFLARGEDRRLKL